MLAKLKWYSSRLKTMTAAEILYRAGQLIQKASEKLFPVIPSFTNVIVHAPAVSFDFSFFPPPNTADFLIFGKKMEVNNAIDFHQDIFSKKKFPLDFSKSIDIRSDRYGSAKVVWEVNRLQFLLPLVINYKTTGNRNCLDLFVTIMTAWDVQNPYMKGVNWYSNIEINIRLINWYWCWIILSGDLNWQQDEKYEQFRTRIWLPLIYKHCYYSYHNPSLHSSANNHLIAEYAGLFVASTLWKFEQSDRWLRKSMAGLEKEIGVQYSENGINREEAAEYIQFITDFFLLAYVSAQQHQLNFSENYRQRLMAICSYINSFLDIRHNFPRYGDEDDGRVMIPDGTVHENNFISILNTGVVLFDRPDFKRQQTGWDLKSHLLTAHKDGAGNWEKNPFQQPPADSFFYEKEGHFIFRKIPAQGREIYAHFDAAPLGFLSIAAHGHADALSLLVNIDGYPFLADPGTFTYHTHKAWRNYFVSTLAHNTVTINHTDQAVLAGPTLWVRHYRPAILKTGRSVELDSVTATHNGYQKQGFEHIRRIEFDKTENKFTITDVIGSKSKEPGQINLPFHLHPGVSVLDLGPNKYQLSRKETGTKIELIVDGVISMAKLEAKDDIPLGWYSPSFMIKEKSAVLMGEYLLDGPEITLTTIIKVIF